MWSSEVGSSSDSFTVVDSGLFLAKSLKIISGKLFDQNFECLL